MPRNVEIKARVPDPDSLRSSVERLADGPPRWLSQEDTFFPCEDGRLKLRRFSDGSAELIYYQRGDSSGPSESRFSKSPVNEPITLLTVLCDALGTAGVVRKQRELFRVGQTRVHLDEVEELGSFVELEVVLHDDQTVADGEAIARQLMAELGISDDDLIDVAYVDLLEESGS
jgi:predicted adenylyl cyclase CyaB